MRNADLRWLAVVPTIIAVYVLGLTFTFTTMDFAMSYCPTDEVVSGSCISPWYEEFEHKLLCAPAFASGLAMVLFPSLVAPSHRGTLSWILYLGGVAVVFVAQFAGFHLEALAATVGGAVALFILRGRSRGQVT